MKILITGADGRLGQRLVARLSSGHELVQISRSIEPDEAHKMYQLDLTDFTRLENIIEHENPQAVIHLAALLGAVCEEDPELADLINVKATGQLAQIAAKYGLKKFIFASTAAVYDQKELAPTDERHNINPTSVYGKTKLKAEATLKDILTRNQVDLAILRIFNIYGPGFDGSLVAKLKSSSQSNPVTVFQPDKFYRDYIFVDDVVDAIEAAVNLDGLDKTIFNIGSGKATNTTELIQKIKESDRSPAYNVQDSGLSVSWADISLAKEVLGFSPHTELVINY